MKKFCTKCGREFEAVGREVICPACKQAAAEESKRAAVMRAKRASWAGESVPVRISGRASTIIREWAKFRNHHMTFSESLDDLLERVTDDDVSEMWVARNWAHWEDITPYKSHRRDKRAEETENTSTTETAQDTASKPQDVQDAPQDAPQEVKQAAKVASKTSTSKTVKMAGKTVKTASKTSRGGKA